VDLPEDADLACQRSESAKITLKAGDGATTQRGGRLMDWIEKRPSLRWLPWGIRVVQWRPEYSEPQRIHRGNGCGTSQSRIHSIPSSRRRYILTEAFHSPVSRPAPGGVFRHRFSHELPQFGNGYCNPSAAK